MKVVQTLGRSKTNKEGTCRYARTSNGVVLDSTINGSLAKHLQVQITIPNQQWQNLLAAIENTTTTLRITKANPAQNNSLHELIEDNVAIPGVTGNDSTLAYIVAILENEGTIDLTHIANAPIRLVKTSLPDNDVEIEDEDETIE